MKDKTIYILMLSFGLFCQTNGQNDTVNRKTVAGNKFGYWKEYFDTGNLQSEGSYKIVNHPMSKEELFMLGIMNADSMGTSSIKVGQWNEYDTEGRKIKYDIYQDGYSSFNEKYYYDANGNLFRTIRNNQDTILGVGQNLKINPLQFNNIGSIGETQTNYLKIKSLSNSKIDVLISGSSDKIALNSTKYIIGPYASVSIPFSYTITQGSPTDTLLVKLMNPDTLAINILIESYGYSLSSCKLQKADKELKTYIVDSDTLDYYREFAECEMRIYNYSKGLSLSEIKNKGIKPVMTIPLSLERNRIDISALTKGSYLIRAIDYNKIDLLAIIKME